MGSCSAGKTAEPVNTCAASCLSFDVDGHGQGGTLREKKLYASPEAERVAKAVIDYG